jgi:lipoate-protein ligase A
VRVADLGARTIDRVIVPCAAAAQLSIEQEIFDGLAHSCERLRLWRPLPALIATLAEAKRPGFAPAKARAEERGLPVLVRSSGGGAVCLGPGTLVVSHFYCSPRNDIDASYRQLAGLLTQAVAGLDVSLTQAQVVGAYC